MADVIDLHARRVREHHDATGCIPRGNYSAVTPDQLLSWGALSGLDGYLVTGCTPDGRETLLLFVCDEFPERPVIVGRRPSVTIAEPPFVALGDEQIAAACRCRRRG